MELSKESLFLLAKKFSNKNFTRPLSIISKTNNIKSNSFAIDNNEKNLNKKQFKFKNKFLEKDNIQINEEKMRKILFEKKNKIKLALSQKNNKENNNILKKIHGTAKLIKIDLDIDKDKDKNNSLTEGINKFLKILKDNRRRKDYINSTFHNSFSRFHNNPNINESNITKKEPKKIYNSNSDYFGTNNGNQIYYPNKNFLRKNMNNINFNDNMKSDYSRNKEPMNNSSSIIKFYSIKKNDDFSYKEINQENEGKNKIKNNNINNNININININNNSNNSPRKIKKIINRKSSRNSPRAQNRKLKSYNYNITSRGNLATNRNDIIKRLPTYNNNKENDDLDFNYNYKEIIIPSSEKKIKKYMSQKYYYNVNQKENKNNKNEYEEIEENEDNDIDDNNKEYSKEKFNIYNINLNFISDKRNNINNIEYLDTDENKKHINYDKSNKNNSPQKIKKEYYKYHGNNNQLYSVKMSNNTNTNLNKNKIIRKDKIINRNDSLNKISNNNSFTDFDYDYDYNNTIEAPIPINPMNIIDRKNDIIQLEDLLILEGKLFHLLNCIKNYTAVPKMCVEWWGFYTYSSFFGKFPKLFPKIKNQDNISDYEIAHDAIILELLSLIVTYEVLSDIQTNKELINILISLIDEIHQNFLIECDYILSKVNVQSINNIWINKLKNLIISKKKWNKRNIFHLNFIKEGNNKIQNYIEDILNIYSEYNSNSINLSSLYYFNENISNLHLIELNKYFNKVINKENVKTGKTFSYIIKTKLNINDKEQSYSSRNVIVPYLPRKLETNKKYTLVLDLDETLINFRFNKKNEGILKIRPGLHNFLKNVGTKYEMVVFTAGTQEYADPIIDIIEKGKKIFVKRLYRQHTVVIDNIFVKDLTKLGRDLSKIIIVDNMPQNFYLQKENGIFIKNYFGQDNGDRALIDLEPILMAIASKPNNDVRKELKKYREEIFAKITIDLS